MKRILVNGASGRIGRAVTYEIVKLLGPKWLTALNDPVGIDEIIESLSGKDPVHGQYEWNVSKKSDKEIIINGHNIHVFSQKDISKIPFNDLGIEIVEECSGFFGDPETRDKTKPAQESSLSRQFLTYGIERVIQSYPAETSDATLICGANLDSYDPQKHRIVSNGSCTTKALVAPLRVLIDNNVGIEALLMDTAHAATNSQNILDSLDQIWTHKTGAAKATGLVISSLAGKMDGFALRVPVKDGSFANMYFVATYPEDLTAEKVNDIFRRNYANPEYMGRLGIFEGKEAGTSDDIVDRKENGVVITSKTRVIPLRFETSEGKSSYLVGIVSGYDNEAAPPVDQVLLTKYMDKATN